MAILSSRSISARFSTNVLEGRRCAEHKINNRAPNTFMLGKTPSCAVKKAHLHRKNNTARLPHNVTGGRPLSGTRRFGLCSCGAIRTAPPTAAPFHDSVRRSEPLLLRERLPLGPVPHPGQRKIRVAFAVEQGELDGWSRVALALLQLEVKVRCGAEAGAA